MPIFNSQFLIFNYLQALDRQLLLAINRAHTPVADAIMVFASNRTVWFPAYALLIGWLIYYFRQRALLVLPLIIVAVALADSITSRLFKPLFARLRPCHDFQLAGCYTCPMAAAGSSAFCRRTRPTRWRWRCFWRWCCRPAAFDC